MRVEGLFRSGPGGQQLYRLVELRGISPPFDFVDIVGLECDLGDAEVGLGVVDASEVFVVDDLRRGGVPGELIASDLEDWYSD
jgi:hypothetical protein